MQFSLQEIFFSFNNFLTFNIFIYFFFGYVYLVLLHVDFLQLQPTGATLQLLCAAFSLMQLFLLQSTSFRAQAQYLCCTGLLLRDTWYPCRPGIKPVSNALAGGFLPLYYQVSATKCLSTEEIPVSFNQDPHVSFNWGAMYVNTLPHKIWCPQPITG